VTAVLYGLALLCVRRRYVVFIVWFVATVALVAVSHQLGDRTNDNLSLPGTDSQAATDVLKSSFPDQANGTSPIVLHAKSGQLTDSKYSSAVDDAAADVAKNPNVASVVNPLTPEGASALSKDKATGYLSVTLAKNLGSLTEGDAQEIIDAAAKPAQAAGLQVETGGQLGQKVSKPSTESSELVGIIAAMVILTLTFGTVTAMLLPILTAIFGLLSTLVTTMGLMAAIAVLVAVLAALTLLPALLAIVGPHIERLRVRTPPSEEAARRGLWARWANEVAKRPLIAGIAALAILIPLTIPLFSLTFGQQDTAALSTSTTARRAYDLISENFGPGVNGPLLIAVKLGSPAQNGADDSRLQKLQKDISATAGVAAVTPAQVDKAGTAAYFNAISKEGPSDSAPPPTSCTTFAQQ